MKKLIVLSSLAFTSLALAAPVFAERPGGAAAQRTDDTPGDGGGGSGRV